MAELQDLVEAHIMGSAHQQKVDYDRHILQSGHSSLGTWYGCWYPQQANWICDGRGTGQ